MRAATELEVTVAFSTSASALDESRIVSAEANVPFAAVNLSLPVVPTKESVPVVSGLVRLFHKPLIQLLILSCAEPKSRTSGNYPVSI